MLDSYVYRNLLKYGNVIISINDAKRYGKKKILNDLLQHGFNCTIRIIGDDRRSIVYPNLDFNEQTVIIEVIKDLESKGE